MAVEFYPPLMGFPDERHNTLLDNGLLIAALASGALSHHWKSKAENLPEDLSDSTYA